MSWQREAKRGWPLGSTGDGQRGRGRLKLVLYCNTRDETGGLLL